MIASSICRALPCKYAERSAPICFAHTARRLAIRSKDQR